ncbi:hypothetical protein [Candidatus Solirubrobacter pratensis]|uniref:hypothetical protein n=1 Tax=Candidatus Solirubrobacter pratensis TaxID=1298857 RepID=UPI000400E55E|nr:hypothetical protein [Candidatus Solirubrobacter pratensis]
MTLIPELERELERVLPPRRRRFSLKLGLGLPVLLVAGTTAALAAGGVIPIGAPAKDPVQPSNPHTGLGQVTGGSSRVLGVQTADPDGGPPWGMQLVTTSRGLGCLQAGRLVNGRIGVLGRDGAFHNDGRFHPFPADGIGHPGTCASLDGARRLIANITLGGIAASASPNAECMPPQFTSGVPKSKLCDPDSVRILYYGTLGPQAQSIVVGSRVIPTTGDDGAYLIVDRIGNSGIGGVGVTPYPTNGPITEIRFKDGSSCKLGPSGPTGPAHTCANPGYTAPAAPPVDSADVRTPIHIATFHRGKHWHARISFRARVAVTDAGSSYGLILVSPSKKHPGRGVGTSTQRDIKAGETVVFKLDWLSGHGRYHGLITYSTRGGAFAMPDHNGALVGRVSFRLP